MYENVEHDIAKQSTAQSWAASLDRAEADLGAGRIVAASEIHALLRATIDEMTVEAADMAGAK